MLFVTKMVLGVTKLCPLVRVAVRGPVLCESATPKCCRVSEKGSPGHFAAKIAFVVANEGYSLPFATKMALGVADLGPLV